MDSSILSPSSSLRFWVGTNGSTSSSVWLLLLASHAVSRGRLRDGWPACAVGCDCGPGCSWIGLANQPGGGGSGGGGPGQHQG